ncbi:MFS general substrate transporter [Thozetella sp. PMI_491]|nr:MFS general substrate transporter [Thozetella sp. PMI_491]
MAATAQPDTGVVDDDKLQTKTSHEEVQQDVDPASERKLKWKLDLFVLPVISSVYFFASMGRSDLGNAQVAGMREELELSPKDYSNATTVFLVAYVLFQLPGTLLVKKIRAPVQFSGAMMVWGLITALTVFVKTPGQLLAVRFLVGMAEAFVQGGAFYLSFWYEYRELATRSAIFFSTSTLAGAFNGLIGYAIVKNLDGANGWRAWRWIFLVEGVLPIAFSFVVLVLLPVSPTELRFGFTAEEKERLIQRSRRAHNNAEARLEVKKIPNVLLSVHFWLYTLIYSCSHFCLSSLGNFLPSIIQGFGYDKVGTQLFTVIVYACACFGIILWARISDRTNARGLTLAISTAGAVVGYAMLIGVTNDKVRFFATCLVAFSSYPNIVLMLSWAAMNFVGYTRRGSALAFLNIFSQLFAISGNQAYLDPPYYRTGNAAALSMSAVILATSLVLHWYLGYLNKKKTEEQFSEKATQQRLQSLEDLGDKHPGI